MFAIDREHDRLNGLQERTFSELGFRERAHLQEWIAKDPALLNEELLIIQKEFAGFNDTSERLDLLALDKQGNLVVIENKLDDSGRDVTWQALKYASYCSSLTKEQVRSIFQQYLDAQGAGVSAEERLCEFFDNAEYEEIELNTGSSQRVILIAANFRKEVTSTVLWLLSYKLRVQCFKVTVFSYGEQLFLNVEQVIPMRDAEEYIISMAAKSQDEAQAQSAKTRRHRVRHEFWTRFLARMNERSTMYQNLAPQESSWISSGSGLGSIGYNAVVTRRYGRAEVYFNRSREENEFLFDELMKHREEIEKEFGGALVWERMEGKQACRIKAEAEGDVFDPERWSEMIEFMVDAMVRLERATRPRLLEAGKRMKSRT